MIYNPINLLWLIYWSRAILPFPLHSYLLKLQMCPNSIKLIPTFAKDVRTSNKTDFQKS